MWAQLAGRIGCNDAGRGSYRTARRSVVKRGVLVGLPWLVLRERREAAPSRGTASRWMAPQGQSLALRNLPIFNYSLVVVPVSSLVVVPVSATSSSAYRAMMSAMPGSDPEVRLSKAYPSAVAL